MTEPATRDAGHADDGAHVDPREALIVLIRDDLDAEASQRLFDFVLAWMKTSTMMLYFLLLGTLGLPG